MHRSELTVDLGAIRRNARTLLRALEGAQLWAVVKANAYGHGAVEVARALEDAGADLLACADIEEGAALRAAGVRAEILVFGALSVSDLDGLFDCRLTPTISTISSAAFPIARFRSSRPGPIPCGTSGPCFSPPSAASSANGPSGDGKDCQSGHGKHLNLGSRTASRIK